MKIDKFLDLKDTWEQVKSEIPGDIWPINKIWID